MNAVELEQVGRRGSAAFDLVHMHDLEPVAGTRVVSGPKNAAHGGPKG